MRITIQQKGQEIVFTATPSNEVETEVLDTYSKVLKNVSSISIENDEFLVSGYINDVPFRKVFKQRKDARAFQKQMVNKINKNYSFTYEK